MTDFNGEILVVGDGGWGTALACLVAANGRPAVIWSYDPDYAALMQRSRSNPKFLPGVELPPAVAVTSDPGRAFARAALVVFAVPTKYARSVLDRLAPDILWVGLSTPKQERWMAEHIGRIKAPVMVGVGAAFDFHTGRKPQAPHWMQRSGLEWLFRLMTEPRRLWKRYLINNPLFVTLVLLQALGLRKYSLDA